MTNKVTDHELLVRIDERQINMECRLVNIEKILINPAEHSFLMTAVKSNTTRIDEFDKWRAGIKGYLAGVVSVTSLVTGIVVYVVDKIWR